MWGDPYLFAAELGIQICCGAALPFDVGSSGGDIVFLCWDPDPRVRTDRAWEGVAQCLMTRVGTMWAAGDAVWFAEKLRASREQQNFRYIA